MAEVKLSEEMQEAFFDRYFEYGDDEETVISNTGKAVKILRAAYKKAEEINDAAENGECFDESEAILAYQTLALSKYYYDQFISMLSEDKRAPYEKVVADILV